MRSRLERIKPLDANVEKDGAKEIQYGKDSYGYLFDDLDEISTDKKIAGLQDIDDDIAALSAISQQSDGIAKALAESEMEELWSASELGKYTIGTPTKDKKDAQDQEQYMDPVSKLQIQEISDDMDYEDAKLQKRLEQIAQELEGIF